MTNCMVPCWAYCVPKTPTRAPSDWPTEEPVRSRSSWEAQQGEGPGLRGRGPVLFRVCGPFTPLPGNHTSVSAVLTLTPEVLWVHSGPVGNVSELTPRPPILQSPILTPLPCPTCTSAQSFPFLSFLLCQTDRNHYQIGLVFPFEASCYARWVPPPGSSGPRTEASLPLG